MDAFFEMINSFVGEDSEFSIFIEFFKEALEFFIRYFSESEE